MENQKVTIDLTSLDSVMSTIAVKKKDIKNPEVIEGLQFMCKHINPKNYTKQTMQELLAHRLALLEGICEVYIEQDQEDLFEVSVQEIDIIKELLG